MFALRMCHGLSSIYFEGQIEGIKVLSGWALDCYSFLKLTPKKLRTSQQSLQRLESEQLRFNNSKRSVTIQAVEISM